MNNLILSEKMCNFAEIFVTKTNTSELICFLKEIVTEQRYRFIRSTKSIFKV